MASVLWVGQDYGNSGLRRRALERIGHTTEVLDPRGFLPSNRVVDKWCFETGGLFLERYVVRRLCDALRGKTWDLALINGGALLGPAAISHLKRHAGRVANYNDDDPFGQRDHRWWRLYLAAISQYDVLFVVRDENVQEARAMGARKVVRVSRGADEVEHRPRHVTPEDRRRWTSQVLFIGTWMPERGPFLAELLHRGVPLTIYGGRWERAREWQFLRDACRGPIPGGDDYARAVQSAKVCLGLLSKGNRDSVTGRSFEIPSLGGLLCAERTAEHLSLYCDGKEAVFWDNAQECATRCQELLADESRRATIAARGRERCFGNGHFSERIMAQIIAETTTESPSLHPQ